jgi:hypothetical protein
LKPIKVAVLRARHDTSVDFISDQACLEMMLINANQTSVLNYWESVTDDYLDFVGSTLFPWVDITIGTDDVSRETQCTRAYEATKALNGGDLEGFDAFAVLTLPGQLSTPNPLAAQMGQPKDIITDFDGGAGPLVQGKPACALPVATANHTFMCHEIGHVFNWHHSYGVLNNGIDWDGKAPFNQGEVYGDPYDIMSSASFGSRWLDPSLTHYSGDPVFTGVAVNGWPNQSAFSMGPAPARAHVHLWDPEALKNEHVVHYAVPPAGTTRRFTLVAAGGGQGGFQLAVLHPIGEDADGRGRCYIEYRQRGGWDAGLDIEGTDLARQGVVVHTLADTAEGVRCWYRGRILVPLELDSDLVVAGTPLTVLVENVDVEGGTVDVAVSTGLARGIDLHTRGKDEIVDSVNPQVMGTPCGDSITYATWITESHYSFQPVSYGFGGAGAPDAPPLKARWSVAGIEVAGAEGSIDAPTPVGTFTIQYVLNPTTAELLLSSGAGEQYRVDIRVTITEADDSGPTTATTVFQPKGHFEGYAPGDERKLDNCMSRYAKSARLRPRDYLIPPGPDPFRDQLTNRINQQRLQQLAIQVADSHPAQANALSALTVLRFGVRGP